jgi:hypothetical protein
MNVNSITPIVYVEAIEPCIPFWTERLGFKLETEVPEGDRLGFVILKKGDVQVMYQTRASVENDVPALAATPMKGSMLFLVVDDIEAIERAMKGIKPDVPRRKTFYGAEELFVREPAGNLVGFAQFSE